jgi:DNA-binding FadR family transcriptional regulator
MDAQLLLLLNDHSILENLIEVRRMIEPSIAALAAEHATEANIAALGHAVRAMNDAGSLEEWRPAHLAFHKALVDATHNVILMKIWGVIAVFLRQPARYRLVFTGAPPRSCRHLRSHPSARQRQSLPGNEQACRGHG